MDIDAGDHPPIAQKLYTLPLNLSQWVCKELEMLEKAENISKSVSHCSRPILSAKASSTR